MTREELQNALQNINDHARLAMWSEEKYLWEKAERHQAQVDRLISEILAWYDELDSGLTG